MNTGGKIPTLFANRLLEDTVWGPPPEYKSRTILTQVGYDISKIVAE